jgi:hypothetical protein
MFTFIFIIFGSKCSGEMRTTHIQYILGSDLSSETNKGYYEWVLWCFLSSADNPSVVLSTLPFTTSSLLVANHCII